MAIKQGNEGGQFSNHYPMTESDFSLWHYVSSFCIILYINTFRLKTYEASKIRLKVLNSLCQQKEKDSSLFIGLGEKIMDN
ncbi:hypothetical protein AE937_07545 [Bacteroides fragilis]|jgi:hypothetical protein bfra3_17003|uniref:Uncharacterized protein n=1 Tax=Bacteroides fragilis TaxID=817 RepID=A0A081U070_BACFG|nr:hypothetical protein BUN20_13400 [Bacteroides fragilis]MBY2894552.1 hypothetical protein [Bacteroides fragilis]MBY2904937.1 hypothetical protein [Bacteroides fragilis]OCL20608.1 hypothetical protein AOQ65_04135 [Bacteroides fragilis]OCM98007.1 hypothetical protein AE749_09765 [Bacteroides fragilis]